MKFGSEPEFSARITQLAALNEALDLFQSRGYNGVDTACAYVRGHQEAFTREAGWKKRGLVLAAKVKSPSNLGDNCAEKILASVETSLAELGTDFVDPGNCPGPLGKRGKDRSSASSASATSRPFELAEVVTMCKYNGWVRPTIYQGMCNIITRKIDTEVFAACRRYGLDIVTYNSVGGGFFSGKIKQGVTPEDGRFSDLTKAGPRYRKRYYRDGVFQALRLVEGVAEKHGLGMIETALRWLLHHSELRVVNGNDGVLVGAASVAQLKSNLDCLEKGLLPEDVVEAAEQAWQIAKGDSADYDTIDALFGAGR
ncbi:hypothetical protein MAC_09138 [Metarhizium acridum CQMa 102]|uniref:NADP-dependent oxidoreductase domain-containing protein n=1 Tax=Metarhizium acridum (strain CQMa 102) TaxID=655827 RepID=E9EGZ0_METAQ|nr:uncharacterized protein MAC_09138 [Metarhizium acridum CQMa 102]EFY84816.1 hypothetical protein MAC_09138 [Metarhizium acridum CQMa 102]